MGSVMEQAMEKYLTFTLDAESFALDIRSVREVLDMTDITRVPRAAEYMRGVVNLRGAATPVLDLRVLLGLEPGERTENTRIVIVEREEDGEVKAIGAIADSVKEVLEMDSGAMGEPPSMGTNVDAGFLRGMIKRGDSFIQVLDAERVFASRDERLSA